MFKVRASRILSFEGSRNIQERFFTSFRTGFELLEHLKSSLQRRAQKIVDVRLARIEFEHGDAALQIEIDFFDAGQRFKRFAQHC
jgi:hypothetical protein